MRKTIAEIIEDVKIVIDEIGANDSGMLTTPDNVDMETIIRSKVVDALHFVNANAALNLLSPDIVYTKESEGVTIDDNLVGHVVLPEGFLRTRYVRLSSWVRYLSEPLLPDDEEYPTLFDEYTTGTWENPRMALSENNTLDLYSAKTEDDEFHVEIMVDGEITTDDDGSEGIDVSSRCYRALVYQVAALTLLTYRETHANDLFRQALILMGAENKTQTQTQTAAE